MAASVKRYWKTIRKYASYTGYNEWSFQKLTKRRDITKLSLKRPSTTRFTFVIQDLCEPSSSKSFTTQYQHHVPCGSCNYVKCSNGWYFEPSQINKGDDATEKFLDKVLAAATSCRRYLTNKIPMKRLTQEQCREYNNATNCLICTKTFKSTDKKVCGHNNLTGEYRGPAATHATRIPASIKRKEKLHGLFATSKVCCFYVIAIFIFASFWNTFS